MPARISDDPPCISFWLMDINTFEMETYSCQVKTKIRKCKIFSLSIIRHVCNHTGAYMYSAFRWGFSLSMQNLELAVSVLGAPSWSTLSPPPKARNSRDTLLHYETRHLNYGQICSTLFLSWFLNNETKPENQQEFSPETTAFESCETPPTKTTHEALHTVCVNITWETPLNRWILFSRQFEQVNISL